MRCELLLLCGCFVLVPSVACTSDCPETLDGEPDVLDVAPDFLDFGDVEVGSTAEQTFVVTSLCRPVQLQDVETSADFTGGWSWTPEAWTDFAGGESIDVTVTYAPLDAGDHDANLYLASTQDVGSYTVVETRGVGVVGP